MSTFCAAARASVARGRAAERPRPVYPTFTMIVQNVTLV